MYPNNTPSTGTKKPLIIALIGFIAIIAVISIVFLVTTQFKKQPTTTKSSPSASTTPLSTPQPTPTPQDTTKASSQPQFLGMDDFLDHGISSNQILDLKYALTKFLTTKSLSTKVLTTSNVTSMGRNTDSSDDSFVITFNTKLDSGATYPAQINYSDLTAIRLYVNDPKTNTRIYDSGLIDLYNGIGNN